jgi:hypothetical protein
MRPEHIADLSEVPEEEAGLYLPCPSGDGLRLHPDLAARHDAHAEAMAARDRQIDRLDRQLREMTINTAVTDALIAGGVDVGFLDAAAALIRQQLRFEVIDDGGDGEAVVCTDFGETSADFAVREWLSGRPGSAYRQRGRNVRPADSPGDFTAALRRLADRPT